MPGAAFQRGAAEGIGFYFAPGDCGLYDPATSCGSADGSTHPQVEYPGESPWVTAVGGTTVELDATGHKAFQTGWGDHRSSLSADATGWTPTPPGDYPTAYQSGGGGGTSVDYAQPGYQAPVVPGGLSGTLPDGTAAAQPMRVVPDVAVDADNNTGMLVGQTQVYPDGVARYHETRWGGTSLACPLFVGIQALAQQTNHGAALGFANPQLYKRSDSAAFDDVTDTPLGPGTNLGVVRNDYSNVHDPSSTVLTRLITFGHDGLLHATTGFDDVTGLGSPGAGYVRSYRGCEVVAPDVHRPAGCQG
jgi:subtilase family serine protease